MAPLEDADGETTQARPEQHTADDPQINVTRRRASRQRRNSRRVARTEPLQRRIMRALAAGPRIPSDLVDELGATKEAISRLLSKLQREAFVAYGPVEGDARRKLYRLTPEGEDAYGRHLAFGRQAALSPAPTDEQTLLLLRAGLQHALRMRRQTNRLAEAASRMRLILDQARELGDNELLIDTMAELAATLRQTRRYEELDELLDEFEQMAVGGHRRSADDPALVLPAIAHREYELGRARDGGISDASSRARHLDAAQSLYSQLARSAEPRRKSIWIQREGWSVLSLAGNLRERSDFEPAVEKASWAMSRFQRIDDYYGESRSLFMIGQCLRLMGDFPQAWRHLAAALRLAQEQKFERFQADTLLQMGDIQRCMGRIELARVLLSEALAQSVRMEIGLMQAFAHSSLGACAYQEGDYRLARAELKRARVVFKMCAHREGTALNTRRQAVVKHKLYPESRTGAADTLKRLVGSAHKQYEALRSPAGAAACDIELGRVYLTLDVEPEPAIVSLTKRLEDPRQKDLIELDPWIPGYLLEFAKRAGDRNLRSTAETVVTDGQRRRCGWYSQLTGQASTTDQTAELDKGALEMGGECRREAATHHIVPELTEIAKPSVSRTPTLAADWDPATPAQLFVSAG